MPQQTTATNHDETAGLGRRELRKNLSASYLDGFFASIFATLSGGPFLTGFALALGANEFQIGLVAAIPLIGNVCQFLGAYLVTKLGSRKPISVRAVTIGRGVWLLMVLLPFLSPWLSMSQMVWAALAILTVGHLFGAVSAAAWLSWMSDLVPDSIRGRFFGTRNMIVGLAVLSFTFLGGKYLDAVERSMTGFQMVFLVAIIAGIVSVRYLRQIYEPEMPTLTSRETYYTKALRPLRDQNFRKLLFFTMLWGFAVNFAGPFFVVYKLRDLQLGFTLVGMLVALTSLTDLLGMRVWGHILDRVGSRAVMITCSVFTALLPFGWLWTSISSLSIYFLLPALHLVGGFFWAGMNLASITILFRLAPEADDTVYFSTFAAVNGLFAALASVAGGLVANSLAHQSLDLVFLQLGGLKIIFLISFISRCAAIPLLMRVHEPRGVPLVKAVRVLRSVRSTTSTQGFHPYLHFFVRALQRTKNRRNPAVSPRNGGEPLGRYSAGTNRC